MRAVGRHEGLGGFAPGDHVCCVLGEDAAIEPLAARWAVDGLAAGDRVMVFAPGHRLSAFDVDRERVALLDPHRAVLGGSRLDPEAMFDAFRTAAADARARGHRTLRVVADMDWLLADAPTPEDLTAFELGLDGVVAEIGAIVLCAYRRATFADEHLEGTRCVHPLEARTPEDGQGDPLVRVWSCGEDRWAVAGEIDLSNADRFAGALAGALSAAESVRLDLGRLRFIDVAGLRALESLARARPNTRIVLEAAPPTLRRCWQLLSHVRLPNLELSS